MLLLLHWKPCAWRTDIATSAPLPGNLAVSRSGFYIVFASGREDKIGLGGKRGRPLRVEDNHGRHGARAVIGVPGVDETPEALATAIAGFLRRSAA
jgi:hypothetical protein